MHSDNSDTSLISIVIPCYNQGGFVQDVLQSIYSQSLQDFEIIIVNDGSDDIITLDVLESLTHPKLKILHKRNGGLSSARNFGIDNAKGEYIVPLDADDMLKPTFLEKCITTFKKNPDISIVTTEVEFFGVKKGKFRLPEITAQNMVIMNCLVATAMFKRDIWQQIGGYSEAMIYGFEDWDFWLKCIEYDLKFYRVNEILFQYRIKRDSMIKMLSTHKTRKYSMLKLLRENHVGLFCNYKPTLVRKYFMIFWYIALKKLQ